MTRVAVRTTDAPPPAGRYSQGIISGPVIALAGQGGFDPKTNELVGPDFADEAHRTFQNLVAVLREARAQGLVAEGEQPYVSRV